MREISKSVCLAALAALLLAAAAPAATTENGSERGWRLRFNGYWIDTNEVQVVQGTGGYLSRVENSAAAGGGVSGEYRFGPRLGVELGVLGGAETDFTVSFGGSGGVVATNTMAFDAACVGLNVHLTPGSKVDFYAGPVVAYVTYSDMLVGVTGLRTPGIQPLSPILVPVSVRFDNELAVGANLGVDVPISQRHWFFNADVRYLDTAPDARLEAVGVIAQRDSVAMDPLMVGVGFGYRF